MNSVLSYTESSLFFSWCNFFSPLHFMCYQLRLGLEYQFMNIKDLGQMEHAYGSGLSMTSVSFNYSSFSQTGRMEMLSISKLHEEDWNQYLGLKLRNCVWKFMYFWKQTVSHKNTVFAFPMGKLLNLSISSSLFLNHSLSRRKRKLEI